LSLPGLQEERNGTRNPQSERAVALKVFPVDIYGVKKLGIEKWQQDFFWPVADEEFFSLCDHTEAALQEEIESRDQALRDVLIANSSLAHEYASVLHALLVIKRLREKGYEILFDERSLYYWELLSERLRDNSNAKPGVKDLVKDRIKQVVKFFVFNQFSFKSALSTLHSRKRVISLGSFSELKKDFCRQQGGLVLHWSPLRYSKSIHESVFNRHDTLKIEHAAESLAGRMVKVAWEKDIPINDFSRRYLEVLAKPRLQSIYKVYNSVLHDDRQRIDLLLLSEVAKPANKAICLALKRKFGTRIIGFEHGNTFGNFKSKRFAANELAHCDEFVVSSRNSIANFRESQSLSRVPYGKSTEIVAVPASHYQELWNRNRTLSLPERIRKIMLIGFPMNQYRYDDVAGHFSLFHLDLELRLARFLKEQGLRVVYKVHPDRLEEARGIFDALADEIRPEPFEKVYLDCDAYLFGHADSSTFGIALCTNKPLILIDAAGKAWNKKPFDLIRKRCRVVPAWMDDSNRIQFDEDVLATHLQSEIAAPNTEFMKEYVCS